VTPGRRNTVNHPTPRCEPALCGLGKLQFRRLRGLHTPQRTPAQPLFRDPGKVRIG